MTRRLCAGLFCALICSSALTFSAEARPRHQRQYVQEQPYFTPFWQVHESRQVAEPRRARKTRHVRRGGPRVQKVAQVRRHRQVMVRQQVQEAAPSYQPGFFTSAGSSVVAAARAHIGKGAVFGRATLWCARFMNVVLKSTGYRGTNSDMARSFTSLPQTSLQVGAIAVLSRGRGGRGGHVGVVSGIDRNGNPIVISGNHGNRVAESVYAKSRVLAYVRPM